MDGTLTYCKSGIVSKEMKWNLKKSLAPLCRLLDRDFQPSSYNDYDFSLPPQYQGTACVLYATAIISKLFSTTSTTYVPEKDINIRWDTDFVSGGYKIILDFITFYWTDTASSICKKIKFIHFQNKFIF